MPRILLIGDVGGPATYHVGDEAMLSANLDGLREAFAGDLEATVVSSCPEWTAEHHEVHAIPPFGFPPEGDSELLARVVEGARTGEPTMPAVAALAASDALLVSGGGNLNSIWRNHLHERIALIVAAAALGKPSFVVGQTLGPRLRDDDRRRLAEALSSSSLVGVRELDSFRLALRLGVPLDRLHYQLDDAFFLQPSEAPEVELPPEPWIAITLTGPAERCAAAWAPALEALHRRTGRPLVFVPHAGKPDDDARLGAALGARLGGLLTPLPLLTDRQVVGITRRAAMVVSSRYHPLVFATAGGVPSCGLFSDAYTRVKLVGALRHAGLDDWLLDLRLLPTPVFLEAAGELWERRDEISSHLVRQRPTWESQVRNHWAAIRQRMADPLDRQAARLEPVPRRSAGAILPEGWWAAVTASQVLDADIALWREIELAGQRESAERYARSLREVLVAREEELVNLKALLAQGPPEGPAPAEPEN